MNRTNRCYFSFSSRRMAVLGSARVSRAGEGILPSRTSQSLLWANKLRKKKSSLPQNAATSTLQACAPRNAVDASSLFIK